MAAETGLTQNAIVLCVDEKSQVQALNRTEPILPLAPGVPARQSYDYKRHGVTSLFAAMEVASSVTIGACYRRRPHPCRARCAPGGGKPWHA